VWNEIPPAPFSKGGESPGSTYAPLFPKEEKHRIPLTPPLAKEVGGILKSTSLEAPRSKGYLLDRTEVTATDKRRGRIDVMTITDWIIQLSIFGVLALAVVGTVQNLVDAMKKKS
jgi:hypothetical protein